MMDYTTQKNISSYCEKLYDRLTDGDLVNDGLATPKRKNILLEALVKMWGNGRESIYRNKGW